MPGWRGAVGVTAAVLSAFCLAGLLATSAWPRMHAGPNMLEGGHRLQGAVAVLDSGGSFGSPAGAYSLRKLKSTYTGPGIRLRRASDNAELDIGFLGFTGFTGAPIDVAAANTHCNATTCFARAWYDQSGGGRDQVNATAATQPQFIFNCLGNLPCLRTIGGQFVQAAAQVTPAGAQSLSTVARVDSAAVACTFVSAGFQAIASGGADVWSLGSGGAPISATAAGATWHATNGVVNAAASVFNVDGAETTGNLAINAATQNFYLAYGGGGATPCSETEAIWWQGYGLTATERAALRANQKSYWGTP